jgi:hypothetical protein
MSSESSCLGVVETLLRFYINTGQVTHLHRKDIDELDITYFADHLVRYDFLGDPRVNQPRVYYGAPLCWKTLAVVCKNTLHLNFLDEDGEKISRLCIAIGETSGKAAWKQLTLSSSEPLATSWCAVKHHDRYFMCKDERRDELNLQQIQWAWAWVEYVRRRST